MIPQDPIEIVAPIVAVTAAFLLFYTGGLYIVGSRRFRWLRSLLPRIDEEARDRGFYTSYKIKEDEYVGELAEGSINDVREIFENRGYIDSPLAAHKTFWGRNEALSMSHYGVHGDKLRRMHPLVRFFVMVTRRKKTHVTVFPGYGSWSVTAHHEYSEYNPLYAVEHLRSQGMDIDEGVLRVTEDLKDVDSFDPSDRALNLYADSTEE